MLTSLCFCRTAPQKCRTTPTAAEGFRSRDELVAAKLTEGDLKELGIGMKARKKLLKALAEQAAADAPPPPPPPPPPRRKAPPPPQCEGGTTLGPDGVCALPSADWLKHLLEDSDEMSAAEIEEVAGILHRADFGSAARLLFGGGDNFMADGASSTNEGIPVTGGQLRELGVKKKAHRKAITKALSREQRLRREDKAAADRAHALVAKRNVRQGKPQEELLLTPPSSTAVAVAGEQEMLAWSLQSVDNALGGPLFSRHYGANPPVRQRLLRPGFASEEETAFLQGAVTHALQDALWRGNGSFAILIDDEKSLASRGRMGRKGAELAIDLVERTRQAIVSDFGLSVPLYGDGALITRQLPDPDRREGVRVGKNMDPGYSYSAAHVDKCNKMSYDYSALLYLSTQGKDFHGGNLTFIDEDADRHCRPTAGLLATFSSGLVRSFF
jgi:hypothetical protein